MDCNTALSGWRARAIPHIEGVSPKPLELKEMVCIPTCYIEVSFEVRALNVTMPRLPLLNPEIALVANKAGSGHVTASQSGPQASFHSHGREELDFAVPPRQRSKRGSA